MSDLVNKIIAFETGEMTSVEEYIDLASELITSGLANSTGSYQRFVADIIRGGYLLPDGTITEKGHAVADA